MATLLTPGLQTADTDVRISGAEAVAVGSSFSKTSRAVYIGTGGTSLTFTFTSGDVVAFANIPNGSFYPFVCTGTTTGVGASGVVACYQ